jgi:hypothetical protein
MRYRRNKNTSSVINLVAFVIYLSWKTGHCNTRSISYTVRRFGGLRNWASTSQFLQLVGWPYTTLDHYKLSMPHVQVH